MLIKRKSTIKEWLIVCLSLIIILFVFSPCFAFNNKKTIGVVMSGDIPYYAKTHKAFLSRLAKEGYGDVKLLVQKPYPDPISWSNAARKLIALDVDIIVTYGAPATLAVLNEKTSIPVVYAGISNPQSVGIAGKNITGAISKAPTSSLLRYLRGITSISNLGVLCSEFEKDSMRQAAELEELSKELGFKVIRISIKKPADVNKIKTSGRLDALFITSSASVNMAIASILEIAKANKLPTASSLKGDNADVIVTLSANPEEQGEIAAEKVIRILEGTNPGTISPTAGKNIELIFNIKENTAMGFKIPMDLVTEATKVIQ